ncbi:MAG: DUF4180 domain-containing protein [Actinophytocola sp.]|uniref:DUF4180 domain-containing protein n=1 Tax=Actinophytocola sp. TaxID=1872138 RepID=UPI001321F299|nr:DUF4180 domain-containing protein [Actinophytocola sp.]MPZ82449.1 DUF4180 domain-containing protein [Actinophytocola sp.]
MNTVSEAHGVRVLTVEPDTPTLGDENDAVELIGAAYGADASVVVVPVEQVDERFFTLGTRIAGEVVRKFQIYQVRLVVLGDITAHLASESFRAFVHEINKGTDIWFLADRAALDERLRASDETLGRSR